MSEISEKAPRSEAYDVAVVGGGPGGYVAAIRAAQLGGRVVLVERGELGGTCTNRGCIPTKALLRSLEVYSLIQKAPRLGINVDNASINFKEAMRRKDTIVGLSVKNIGYLLKKNNVEVIHGNGILSGQKQIQVSRSDGGKADVNARSIILATGSAPARIPVAGAEGTGVITSDEALQLEEAPESIVIAGGGAVGLEFGSIFNGYGSKVTVLEMMSQILPGEDREIAIYLRELMQRNGVDVHTDARVLGIDDTEDDEKIVHASLPQGEREFQGRKVLLATGRIPLSSNIGLENLGVKTDRGKIVVDEHMQTNIEEIYAIGDVVGKFMLAHVAMVEGVVASENAMGMESLVDYKVVPRCIYTHPEVASIGLSEDEARKTSPDIKVGRFPFSANGRAATLDEMDGLVKIVAEGKYGEILGAQVVGPEASELIHEIALAMKLEATSEDIINTIHSHPTLSEAIREAALRLENRAIHI